MTQGQIVAATNSCAVHIIKGQFVCAWDFVVATCVPATHPCYMSPRCKKQMILLLQHVARTFPVS